MTQQQGPEGPDIVDIAVAIGVPDPGPLAADDDRGFAPDRAVGSDRAVHAPREKLLGALAPGEVGRPGHQRQAPVLGSWRGKRGPGPDARACSQRTYSRDLSSTTCSA